MRQPKSTDWAYLAALVDGEGSILLVKNNKQRNLQGRVVIAMSTQEPLFWVHNTFDGGCYRDRMVKANGRLERRFHWGVYSYVWSWYICDGMLPYLRLKKHKAEEVITYASKQLEDEDISKVS